MYICKAEVMAFIQLDMFDGPIQNALFRNGKLPEYRRQNRNIDLLDAEEHLSGNFARRLSSQFLHGGQQLYTL